MGINDIYQVFAVFDTNSPFQQLPNNFKKWPHKEVFNYMISFVVNSPYTKLHVNGLCQKVYKSIFKLKQFDLNFIVGPGLRSVTQGST